MNHILFGWSQDRHSHIRLSLGALKSSDENVIKVFLLSVLPSFCIRETIHHLSSLAFRENYKKLFLFERFSNLCNSHLYFGSQIFRDLCLKSTYFFNFIRRISNLWLKSTILWWIKQKKTQKKPNKIEKIRWFWPSAGKISVQLEDEYHQNGKNNQTRKIYDNFRILVQILAQIIINFLDFRVFPNSFNSHL